MDAHVDGCTCRWMHMNREWGGGREHERSRKEY